jgi:hypothetical protein
MATTKRKRAPRRRAAERLPADVLRLALDQSITSAGLPDPTKEFQFARKAIQRQWRIDLSWPDLKIACEIEGGTYLPGGGAHQRAGKGGRYLSDMQKYNRLALWGWLLIRVTYDMIADGSALDLIQEAHAYRRAQSVAA